MNYLPAVGCHLVVKSQSCSAQTPVHRREYATSFLGVFPPKKMLCNIIEVKFLICCNSDFDLATD